MSTNKQLSQSISDYLDFLVNVYNIKKSKVIKKIVNTNKDFSVLEIIHDTTICSFRVNNQNNGVLTIYT